MCMYAIGFLMAFVAACSAATPTADPYKTPPATRAQPEDISHQALADALSEVEYEMAQARSILVYISKAPQAKPGATADCKPFVEELARTNPQYAEVGVATPNGQVNCDSATHNQPLYIGETLYFNRLQDQRDFVIGEYLIAGGPSRPALGLAYPILGDTKRLDGIVIAPLRLDWIANRLSGIEIPVTGEMLVIDTEGTILLRDPDASDWVGKSISDIPLGQAMLTKIQGSGEFAGADGVTRFYSFASPVSSNNELEVAVGIPR